MIPKYDIWLAKVRFTEIEETKERPVLILDHINDEVFCLRMTSKLPQTYDDYVIVYWKEAGLFKPTVINTALRLRLKRSKLISRIGTLQDSDRILMQIRHTV